MNPVCTKRGPYHAFTWSYHQVLQSLTPEHHRKQSEKKKNAKDAIHHLAAEMSSGGGFQCALSSEIERSPAT